MVLPVLYHHDTKIYNVSGYDSSKLPDWLIHKHRRTLKKDPNFGSRIELIQDFEFPEATNRLLLSSDGQFFIGTGVYKPQIRVWEAAQCSLKFERHTNAENVAIKTLAEDWTKLLLLQSNRQIEFHTQGGIYYSTRIPKFGRDILYDPITTDALTVGDGHEAWRLNLEQGRFLKPFATEFASINALDKNPCHRLYAFGGPSGTADGGRVEYWDARTRARVGQFDTMASETTSLLFLPDGMSLAVGTLDGTIQVYDLRESSRPTLTKDHGYGLPIKRILHHSATDMLYSADSKVIKIWNRVNGSVKCSIEPSYAINDLCLVPHTGFISVATESSSISSYYVPSIGPAPKWASFLDSLTEELEESATPTLYDNYKFLSRKELTALGLDHLIGTNILRSYMHGYFIDHRLYEKARALINPFAYEEYRASLIRRRIEKESESRIGKSQTQVKVNKKLHEKLTKASSKKGQSALDARFSEAWSNQDFQIDESSREYQLLHPAGKLLDQKEDESDAELALDDDNNDAMDESDAGSPHSSGSDSDSPQYHEEEDDEDNKQGSSFKTIRAKKEQGGSMRDRNFNRSHDGRGGRGRGGSRGRGGRDRGGRGRGRGSSRGGSRRPGR